LIEGSSEYIIKKDKLTKNALNNFKLNIRYKDDATYDEDDIGADPKDTVSVTDTEGNIVGKIFIICSKANRTQKLNLVKVYLGDDRTLDNPKTPQQLLTEAITFMNIKAYNQALIKFEPGGAEELIISNSLLMKNLSAATLHNIQQLFNNSGEINFVNVTPHLKIIDTIMNVDNRFANWKNDKIIIVIANRVVKQDYDGSRTLGFTETYGDNTGYYSIMYHNAFDDYYTYTHELGHALGLKHPFSDKIANHNVGKPMPLIPQGNSRNFMDYSSYSDMFWKWQWKIIRKNAGKKVDETQK
jgi:hypothetical protein